MSAKNQQNKNYIFVSAMPSDYGVTMPYINTLRERGYDIVVGTPRGMFAASKLKKVIRKAAAVVAFLTLSSSAKERAQFNNELKTAVKYNIPVIQVNIGFDTSTVPEVLKKAKHTFEPIECVETPYYIVTDIELQLNGICAPAHPSEFHDSTIAPEDEALSSDKLFEKGLDAENRGMAAKAARYYSLASEKGHVAARRYLGYCYEYGRGVKQDYLKAAECYETAISQGDVPSLLSLGNLYYSGHGVPLDLKKALEYFEIGAAKGYGKAQSNAGMCYLEGTGTKVDEEKAMYYYQLAAESGIPQAQYTLGVAYEHGRYGMPQDDKKSFEYYSRAAAQDFEKAYGKVGVCYFEGAGTEKNEQLAAKYFERAAHAGDSFGQYNFGFCLYRGKGVAEDRNRALHYIAMAAKQGHSQAISDLKKLGRTDLMENC